MEKDNKTSKLLLIVFIIISVVLGGFIIYDKALRKKENVNNNQENTQKQVENDYTLFKNKYIADRQKNMNSENKKYFTYMENSVYLDYNGELYYYNSSDVKQKIASNVLKFRFLPIGNGGYYYLYLIKEDGTVSSTNLYYNYHEDADNVIMDGTKIDVQNNIGSYKNIVDLLPGTISVCDDVCDDTGSFIAVDINGNIYKNN